jgi:hypothetical protein
MLIKMIVEKQWDRVNNVCVKYSRLLIFKLRFLTYYALLFIAQNEQGQRVFGIKYFIFVQNFCSKHVLSDTYLTSYQQNSVI